MTATFEMQLRSVLADVLHLPPEAIVDELAIGEIDVWDSLKHIELICSLEEAFALELSLDEIVAMRSVAEIKNVLANRIPGPAGGS